ncbi:MAG TPA: hypothetical protein VFQ30_11395 [Ktedonobacteraceae bacterium]|nr:hypothetical protein [Ktedonobacteraceae bacterium]
MATVPEEIFAITERLSPDDQRRVLEFAQELVQIHRRRASLPRSTPPPGKPGKALLGFKLPLEDVEAMERAIEDCERVDLFGYVVPNEWYETTM